MNRTSAIPPRVRTNSAGKPKRRWRTPAATSPTWSTATPAKSSWTSGATEADNLALKGAAHFHQRKGKHIITSKIEHKAVLDSCRQLEREGYEVTYLDPDGNGLISPETVEKALRPDTILVSLMHVNNEIGVINDIEAIGEVTRRNKVIFHVDAAQSAGKLEIDLERMQVDLMAFTAHKIYGPKGIGALYVRRKPRARIEAQMHGGGHERGMRSGTLATHQIVGMGEAYRIAREEMAEEASRTRSLRDRLLRGLEDIEEVYVNGDLTQRAPGNLNISFNFVEGESLMMALRELALSSGSACTSASLEPSYVLRAIGRNDELAHSSLRISIGPLHHRGRYRLRDRTHPPRRRQAAGAFPALGHVQGWRRSRPGPMGRTLTNKQEQEHHGLFRQGTRPLRKPAQCRPAR